jgi:hypothetical protein
MVLIIHLESIPKPLSAAIGCKVRRSALSVKEVLNVLQHTCEPFSPPALTTAFSLDLVTKQVLGWILEKVYNFLYQVGYYSLTSQAIAVKFYATIPHQLSISSHLVGVEFRFLWEIWAPLN